MGLIAAAIGLFIGTNIDALLVLTALFFVSHQTGRPRMRQVVTGWVLGSLLLIAASCLAAGNLASIGFNVAHVHTTAAVPPIAALLAFELATRELSKALRAQFDAFSKIGPRPVHHVYLTGPQPIHATGAPELTANVPSGELPQVGPSETEPETSEITPETSEETGLTAEQARAAGYGAGQAKVPAAQVTRQIRRDRSQVSRWYRKWDADSGETAA